MQLHLLLTPEVKKTMPNTVKMVANYGTINVVFEDESIPLRSGENCILEDEKENIVNWLRPFDEVLVGSGTPQLEEFTIMHIK